MKRLPKSLRAVSLLVLVAPTPAQDRSIDALFPDSSFAVLRFAGLDRCRDTAAAMKMFELGERTLERAGIQPAAMTGRQIRRGLEQMKKTLRRVGLDANDIRTLLRGECAVGVGRLTLYAGMTPSLLLALDGRGRNVDATVTKLEHILAERGVRMGLEWSSERFGCTEIRKVRVESVGAMMTYAQTGGYLLIGTGEGYLRECIRTLQGKRKSIRTNPAYAKGVALQPAKPLLSVFLNARPLGSMLAPLMPYEAPAIGESLGIEQFDGIYWSCGADAHGSMDVAFLGVRGNEKGLLKALFRQPSSLAAARLAPADTVLFATASLDPKAFVAATRTIVAHLPGEARRELERGFRRGVIRELNRELRHVGLSLAEIEKMLQMFGSEASVAVQMPLKQGPMPGITGFIKLRDPQGAEDKLLTYLRRFLNGKDGPKLRTRTVKGHRIHFVSVRAGVQLTPAFTILGDQLVVSPVRMDLEHLVKGLVERKPRLADLPEFRQAAQEAGRASLFMTVRLGTALAQGWGMARGPLQGFLRRLGSEGMNENVIPTKDEIAGAFGTLTLAATAREDGFVLKQRHPVGIGALLALAGWGADWFLGKAANTD